MTVRPTPPLSVTPNPSTAATPPASPPAPASPDALQPARKTWGGEVTPPETSPTPPPPGTASKVDPASVLPPVPANVTDQRSNAFFTQHPLTGVVALRNGQSVATPPSFYNWTLNDVTLEVPADNPTLKKLLDGTGQVPMTATKADGKKVAFLNICINQYKDASSGPYNETFLVARTVPAKNLLLNFNYIDSNSALFPTLAGATGQVLRMVADGESAREVAKKYEHIEAGGARYAISTDAKTGAKHLVLYDAHDKEVFSMIAHAGSDAEKQASLASAGQTVGATFASTPPAELTAPPPQPPLFAIAGLAAKQHFTYYMNIGDAVNLPCDKSKGDDFRPSAASDLGRLLIALHATPILIATGDSMMGQRVAANP